MLSNMLEPVVVVMGRDERPTEAGTYVVRLPSSNVIAQVSKVWLSRRWHVKLLGSKYWQPIDGYEFIARIYPDRITPGR